MKYSEKQVEQITEDLCRNLEIAHTQADKLEDEIFRLEQERDMWKQQYKDLREHMKWRG